MEAFDPASNPEFDLENVKGGMMLNRGPVFMETMRQTFAETGFFRLSVEDSLPASVLAVIESE